MALRTGGAAQHPLGAHAHLQHLAAAAYDARTVRVEAGCSTLAAEIGLTHESSIGTWRRSSGRADRAEQDAITLLRPPACGP